MAALLALALGGFAFFLDRIFRDADRLKAFYAAEEDARARDMDIAKSIQNSALPAPLGANPYFSLSASIKVSAVRAVRKAVSAYCFAMASLTS